MVFFRWAFNCARPLASVTSGEIFKLQGRTKAPQETPRRRRDKPKDGPLSHREHPKSAAKRAPRRKSRGAPDRHAPLQASDRGQQRGHHLQQETAPQEKKTAMQETALQVFRASQTRVSQYAGRPRGRERLANPGQSERNCVAATLRGRKTFSRRRRPWQTMPP